MYLKTLPFLYGHVVRMNTQLIQEYRYGNVYERFKLFMHCKMHDFTASKIFSKYGIYSS
jgi:hypothetical protein